MKKLFNLLKAAPHAEALTDEAEITGLYRHWQRRTLYSMMIGYAAFYFVRKNFTAAMPLLLDELGYTKTDLGIILTLFSLVYGFGKFANGILADRMNARYFMAVALIGSAIVNVFFGLTTSLYVIGTLYLLNGWFQSIGMPASVRLLTRWYSPTQLGTVWGIQSTAHQIGGAGIMFLAAWLVPNYGWRSVFYVPAFIAMTIAFVLLNRLRDTPQSIGLPPPEVHRKEATLSDDTADSAMSWKEILFDHVLKNRLVWVVAFANIFVYVVRIGIMDWAPTFLIEARGATKTVAYLQTAAFELAGIIGTIGAGWVSDKIFRGRRGPLATVSMFLLAVSIGIFWLAPQSALLDGIVLVCAGVLVYAPQLLVPLAAADFASRKAACTATGLTGWFGYIGSALAGVGTGAIADTWGWNGGFIFFMGAALMGTALFALTWNHRAPQLEKYHNHRKGQH